VETSEGRWTPTCPQCSRVGKERGSERRAQKWLDNHTAFAHPSNNGQEAE
jgi:hypothetical protein